ncbi:hypothetical protein LX32DRAFT_246242 [Colletotrichum zoysiae]|uniref:Uncharacterized protein n=1 Tax=Colletotrichum zoysiae TaxID=1216348 RepID=A0AAD9HPM5_9PEZI|nr:hypothetical protein LX32DRAFT_246242 [Colletotrichum zoysiae]
MPFQAVLSFRRELQQTAQRSRIQASQKELIITSPEKRPETCAWHPWHRSFCKLVPVNCPDLLSEADAAVPTCQKGQPAGACCLYLTLFSANLSSTHTIHPCLEILVLGEFPTISCPRNFLFPTVSAIPSFFSSSFSILPALQDLAQFCLFIVYGSSILG